MTVVTSGACRRCMRGPALEGFPCEGQEGELGQRPQPRWSLRMRRSLRKQRRSVVVPRANRFVTSSGRSAPDPAARRTRHTGTQRPTSTTEPSQQCGGFPLCGDLGVVQDARSSAMRESSALSGHRRGPADIGATFRPGSPLPLFVTKVLPGAASTIDVPCLIATPRAPAASTRSQLRHATSPRRAASATATG